MNNRLNWRKYPDEIPDFDRSVLIHTETGMIMTAEVYSIRFFDDSEVIWEVSEMLNFRDNEVTHFIYIDELPKPI